MNCSVLALSAVLGYTVSYLGALIIKLCLLLGPFKVIKVIFFCASGSYETNFKTKIAPLRSLSQTL